MPEHRVGTQEEWQAERDELLAKEKELTRLNDELAERRRQLPWVPVDKEYSFETEDGPKTLAELFDARSQPFRKLALELVAKVDDERGVDIAPARFKVGVHTWEWASHRDFPARLNVPL